MNGNTLNFKVFKLGYDDANRERLIEFFENLSADSKVVLDCREVDFLTSSVISTLIKAYTIGYQKNACITLAAKSFESVDDLRNTSLNIIFNIKVVRDLSEIDFPISNEDLLMSVDEKEGTKIFKIENRIFNLDLCNRLGREFDLRLDGREKMIFFNFTNVEFFPSILLGQIVRIRNKVYDQGTEIKLGLPDQQLISEFEELGLGRVLQIAKSQS